MKKKELLRRIETLENIVNNRSGIQYTPNPRPNPMPRRGIPDKETIPPPPPLPPPPYLKHDTEKPIIIVPKENESRKYAQIIHSCENIGCKNPHFILTPFSRIVEWGFFKNKYYNEYYWECLNCGWRGKKFRVRS